MTDSGGMTPRPRRQVGMETGAVLGVLVPSFLLLVASCADPDPRTRAARLDRVPIPAEMVVVGDFGSGTTAETRVAATMREEVEGQDVDLFITTGDNFYSDDVNRIWHEPYGWVDDEGMTVAASWGNHDVETPRRRDLVEDVLGPPGRWYSADLGTGKLIILDSNAVEDPDQLEWIEAELENASPPVVIAFHHPAHSCGFHGSDRRVQQTWLPIFERHAVTLVLNGHDHHYQRFVIGPTTYVVTGGGGAGLRRESRCPATTPEPVAANHVDHHFVLVELGSESMSGEVIDVEGRIIDRFDIDY